MLILGKQLVRHNFSLAVENQIKSMAEFQSHKRPSGANDAIHPSQMGRGGGLVAAVREPAIDTPEPFSLLRVVPSRQTQQANNGPPSRESSCKDRVRRMVVMGLFQFNFGSQWVRKRGITGSQSHAVT